MPANDRHTRGIVATILFHGSVILLLIFFGLHAPFPPPQEEALLVNFGTDNTGTGLLEPAPAPPASRPEPAKKTPPKTSETPKEKILTQDIEEAAAVPSGKETKPKKPTAEELRKQREAEEARKKQQEELKRKRREELERKRREEEERKRREEEARIKRETEQRTKNAFSNAQGTANTESEGETGDKGNQGVPEGAPQAGAHSGTPGNGNGISYSLAGRKPLNLVKPVYSAKETGRVVVEVTVDRNGNVTKAIPGKQGSTTMVKALLEAAKKAALASKFDRKSDAPAYQKGEITYVFIRD